jgi:hypothetical protein
MMYAFMALPYKHLLLIEDWLVFKRGIALTPPHIILKI